jgi:SAM-dependent methyltransferase
MKYPDYKTYRDLYARYYDGRNVSELLDLLDPVSNTRFLDLCGGDGRLALAAQKRGARHVTLVDAERAMVPHQVRNQVNVYIGKVAQHLAWMADSGHTEHLYDRIACRQAVNYWLDEHSAKLVADVLAPYGIFAFNTFNQKPPEVPRVLQYELDGHSFVEMSWLVEDEVVHHLQVREGLEPHHTFFQWLSDSDIRGFLDPYFVVACKVDKKTSLYRCVKK